MVMMDFGTLEEELLKLQAMDADPNLASPSPTPAGTPVPAEDPLNLSTSNLPSKKFNIDTSDALHLVGSVGGNFLPPYTVSPSLNAIKSGVYGAAGNAIGQGIENTFQGGTNKNIIGDSIQAGLIDAGIGAGGQLIAPAVTKVVHAASKGIGAIPFVGDATRSLTKAATSALPFGEKIVEATQSNLTKTGRAIINSVDDVSSGEAIAASKKRVLETARATKNKLYDIAQKKAGDATFKADNTFFAADDLASEMAPGMDPTGLNSKGSLPGIVKNLQESGGVYNYKQLSTALKSINKQIQAETDSITGNVSAAGEKMYRLKDALIQDLDEFAQQGGQAVKAAHNAANKFYSKVYAPLKGDTAKTITKSLNEHPEKFINKVIDSEVSVDKVKNVVGHEGWTKVQQLYEKKILDRAYDIDKITGTHSIDPSKLKNYLVKNAGLAKKMLGPKYDSLMNLTNEAIHNPAAPMARNFGQTVGSIIGPGVYKNKIEDARLPVANDSINKTIQVTPLDDDEINNLLGG